MELMLQHQERDESIHVQQVSHGKSARISRTSALVSLGAFKPAVRTGCPVTGSRMMRAFRGRTFRGVRTIFCPSTLASSESPGCRPSLRRILPGTTTWPFVETVVITVRRSYHNVGPAKSRGPCGGLGTLPPGQITRPLLACNTRESRLFSRRCPLAARPLVATRLHRSRSNEKGDPGVCAGRRSRRLAW